MAASLNVKPRSIPWTHRPIHTPGSIPKRRWSRPIHTSRSPRADPYPNFDTIPNMFKSFWNEIVKNWNPKIPCQIYRKMKQYGISIIEDEGTTCLWKMKRRECVESWLDNFGGYSSQQLTRWIQNRMSQTGLSVVNGGSWEKTSINGGFCIAMFDYRRVRGHCFFEMSKCFPENWICPC